MLYEDGITVSFNLNGFNTKGMRETRIFGTRGDIYANFEDNYIRVRHFGEEQGIVIRPEKADSGHGGGDFGLMKNVIHCIRNNNWDNVRTNVRSGYPGGLYHTDTA